DVAVLGSACGDPWTCELVLDARKARRWYAAVTDRNPRLSFSSPPPDARYCAGDVAGERGDRAGGLRSLRSARPRRPGRLLGLGNRALDALRPGPGRRHVSGQGGGSRLDEGMGRCMGG